MGRIMIAGASSGCGKTTVVCALLQALVNRGLGVASFKCGPDYIDPMFHSRIIGARARNLDGFFMDKDTVRYLLARGSVGMELAVMEGVMGYYDGLGMTDTASSYALARDTQTPTVLVLSCQGMSRSVQAVLGGYLDYVADSGIRGVIFNKLPLSLYPAMQEFCKKRGVRALGCFPKLAKAELGSRHLGLVTADEVTDLKERMQLLAQKAEQYLDIDGLLALSKEAPKLLTPGCEAMSAAQVYAPVRVGVARDLAFCFYYEDNLELLRELGCELVEFSPLADEKLPEGLDGLLLGGGYPELHAGELSQNITMRADVRRQIVAGLPTHAECGGFLYLHGTLQTPGQEVYPMAGVLEGSCFFTDRLQHFGYVTLTAQKDSVLAPAGASVRAHEFHRCVSTASQDVFLTEKNGKSWNSYVAPYRLAAGFPHMHYYANPEFAKRFVQACRAYRIEKEEG